LDRLKGGASELGEVAAVVVGQMDEGHLVGHEVAVHVLDDHGYGVGDDDADVRRPLVLPDPKFKKYILLFL